MTTIENETKIINDATATLAAKVAAAAKLWALIEECQKALEPFKREMRERALAQCGNAPLPFTCSLDGEGLTQCRVVIPAPSLRLLDGVTVEGERAKLGELFDAVYEVKLTLRKPDPKFIGNFPPAVREHVASVTAIVDNTPRVSLRSLPGVDPVT